VETAGANGKSTPQACRGRWRKEYGGLKLKQAKRLKALEKRSATAESSSLCRSSDV